METIGFASKFAKKTTINTTATLINGKMIGKVIFQKLTQEEAPSIDAAS